MDEAAGLLFDLYGERLLRSAFLLCGNEADAQDLTQETLLQAIRSAARFRGQSRIYTWLHGILLNLTRRHHRQSRRTIPDDQLASREIEEPMGQANFASGDSIVIER
jgi:RNA polymerase sigma-70 factor (ECF subfamily)